jgi:poly-gamma-glutamate synthesis protein (capsule biosynthesis protein)
MLQRKYLKEANRKIYFSGMRKTTFDGIDVQMIYKNNLRIAFVCVTEILNIYNASRHKVQFYYYNKEYRDEFAQMVAQIKQETKCDLFVLSIHTAEPEYVRDIPEQRKEYFRHLAGCGADIIWAHHPHVVLPWEKYITKSGRETLIMYSMGNFVSGQRYIMNYKNPDSPREYTGDSYILNVDVLRQWGSDNFTYKLTPIPITTKVDYSTRDVKVCEFTQTFIKEQTPKLQKYYTSRFNLMKEQLGILLPWEKLDSSDDALILEAN